MGMQEFYESYEPLRLQYALAKTAREAGRAALNQVEAERTPIVDLPNGFRVYIDEVPSPVEGRMIMSLNMVVAESVNGPIATRYAHLHTGPEGSGVIEYPRSRVSGELKADFDEERDRETAAAYEAIRDHVMTTVAL